MKQKSKNVNIIRVIFLFLFLMELCAANVAQARVIFSTEEGTTNADTFVIDKDDSSTGYIKLQFGDAVDAYLRYDIVSAEFDINKDINFNQYQARNFVMHRGTTLPGSGTGGQLFYDYDDDLVYYYDWSADNWEPIAGTGVDATTLDGLDSSQFLRSDTSDSFTNGTLDFANGTTLQISTGATIDIAGGATANIPETTAETFTLDADDTGGNVSLEFGDALGETLTWNNVKSQFGISDDLEVSGSGTITGYFRTDGDIVLGSDSNDTIDINAKLADNLDFNQNEARNMVLHSGTSFPVSPVEGQKFYRSDLNIEYIFNGTNWIATSSLTGSSQTIIFASQYEDATLFGDGTNNRGTMAVDHDPANNRNYYEWSSRRAVNQDYDIALQVYLPDDFNQWKAAPIELTYKTDSGSTLSKIDVNVKDSSGNNVTVNGGGNLESIDTWTTANITYSGSPTWTPGSYFTIFIKMTATRSGGMEMKSYVGELKLNYFSSG